MASTEEIVRALAKIELVNLSEQKVTCMTSRNFRVSAAFPISSYAKVIPAVGEVWLVELSQNEWRLTSRVDDNSRVFWAYKALISTDNDVFD